MQNIHHTLFLMAAGEGTRLRPHTVKIPKPCIPFLNIPLMYYSLSLLEWNLFSNLVVNTFHLPKKIEYQLEQLYASSDLSLKNIKSKTLPQLNFSHETKMIQGSGGGIKFAEKFLDGAENFWLANADEITIPLNNSSAWMQSMYKQHIEKNALMSLLVMEHPEAGTTYNPVWADKNNFLMGIGRDFINNSTAHPYHYIGVLLASRRIFEYLPKGPSHIFKDALIPAMAKGEKCLIYNLPCHWQESGNENDFMKASQSYLEIIHKKSKGSEYLIKILNEYTPGWKIHSSSDGICLTDSSGLKKIESGEWHIKGNCILGQNLVLDTNVVIENSVLGPGLDLSDSKVIQNKLII